MAMAVAMRMRVTVRMSMPSAAVAVTMQRLAWIDVSKRRAGRLIKHVNADRRYDEKASSANSGNISKAHTGTAPQNNVCQPNDDHCCNDVHDCDLHRHQDAATDIGVPSYEVGHHDELAVARPKGVEDPVDKRNSQTKEKRAKIVTALDCVHMCRNFGVCTSLKINDEVCPPLP